MDVSFGDRANGGLRKVDAENGELVIERYSPKESRGACCPKYFTRHRYELQQGRFREKGTAEMLPNAEGHSSPVMPRYQPMT